MTAATPIIIEAALNGPWGRALQPGMPITEAECIRDGIEAGRRGAAIIHLHVYDPATGRQNDDWQGYARIIEAIRAAVDVIVYPTIPLAGSGMGREAKSAADRYAHVAELGRRGLLEMAAVDPGSVNFVRKDQAAQGFIYENPPAHVEEGLRLCSAHDLLPGYAIYETGFTRAGAVHAAAHPGLRTPLYRFMFSDGFAWGLPPREVFLDAHLALLADCAPAAAWMVAGLDVDIMPLIPAAVARGGHVRVGLEDAPLGTPVANADWVAQAVAAIRDAGAAPATGPQARALLARSGRIATVG